MAHHYTFKLYFTRWNTNRIRFERTTHYWNSMRYYCNGMKIFTGKPFRLCVDMIQWTGCCVNFWQSNVCGVKQKSNLLYIDIRSFALQPIWSIGKFCIDLQFGKLITAADGCPIDSGFAIVANNEEDRRFCFAHSPLSFSYKDCP